MKFLGSSTITGKNQITIPLNVVKALEIKKGEQLIFLQNEEGIIIITKEIDLPRKVK